MNFENCSAEAPDKAKLPLCERTTTNMLTIQECRESLDLEINESLTDKDVEAVRDALYGLARLALSAQRKETINNDEVT
jgi:hypothetical protein